MVRPDKSPDFATGCTAKDKRRIFMARQAMWVHGNAAVVQYPGGKGDPVPGNHTPGHQMNGVWDSGRHIEWSDVVGMHRGPGATFRGRAGNTNFFHFSIPSPCWRDGVRARLLMVGVKFDSSPCVIIRQIHLFDGAIMLPGFSPNVEGPGDSWVPDRNYFVLPNPPELYGGLGVSFEVSFEQEGDITFYCVGADFEV
jgi:hypothetical protein